MTSSPIHTTQHRIEYAVDQTRTMNAQWSLFPSKFQTFGLGQTIWADKFWSIWGIFGWLISTHFGTVSPLSMFSINQPLFLQKTKPLYPNPSIFICDWGLNLGCKELVIKPSCVRSPCFGPKPPKLIEKTAYQSFIQIW